MPKQLEVWLFGEHIGTLSQIEGRLSFSYTTDWLEKNTTKAGSGGDTIPLSQSLPLRAEPFDDRAARPYFAGLLPEGAKLGLIAQALHVSRKNDFGLLDGIGGECAGAVTLLEPGQTPETPDSTNAVRWLDGTQLLRLLDEMPKRPMLAGEGGIRLSLAGAQDKLPVVAESNRIGVPLQGTPSSHIIKPPIAGVEGSVFNEGFCMRLAAALKLDVARASIHGISDQRFLLVERYDRRLAKQGNAGQTQLQRLHQEDFCQALGVAPETKYQNEGGPDLTQAFDLVRRATRPSAPNTLRLLDFVVFNALIGNHDAHAKNFSLLYTAKGAVLAPMYDALSTAVYPDLSDKMAMKIGSKYKFADVQARHWEQFALAAALSPSQVKKRIVEIAKRLPELARTTLATMNAEGNSHSILGKIVTLIDQRCALTIHRLSGAGATNTEDVYTEE
ncbi:MAG: type II toxin-antitoxin system HipA family toxin [Betaproteobacteria bacterium]|nr:type II toxin-antitoxin system HipA family toxin [Betaproteobacteria bacterium]